jgi:hypothetical protein
VDTPSANRRDFFVYIDEFQSFTTLALANMLSELRKYRVGFTIAHQYLHQLTPEIRHAALGNVGTFVSFRIGLSIGVGLGPLIGIQKDWMPISPKRGPYFHAETHRSGGCSLCCSRVPVEFRSGGPDTA